MLFQSHRLYLLIGFLNVLSHEFFGGRRRSAGSRLFVLLLGTFFLGPLVFFGFGHHGLPVLSAILALHRGSVRVAVNKGREGKRRGPTSRSEVHVSRVQKSCLYDRITEQWF